MSRDPVIDDVRAIRDAIAKEHNYDLDSIFRMLRSRETASGHPHVTLSPRPLPVALSTESEITAQQALQPTPFGGAAER